MQTRTIDDLMTLQAWFPNGRPSLKIYFLVVLHLVGTLLFEFDPAYKRIYFVVGVSLFLPALLAGGVAFRRHARLLRTARAAEYLVCPACRYELRCEDNGILCPECGTEYSKEELARVWESGDFPIS